MIRAALTRGPGGPATPITWTEAKTLVTSGCDGTLWIDSVKPDATELAELEHVFGLHALTIEDFIHRNQRAKVEEFPGYLFVVMHWYPPAHDHSDHDPHELHCVLGKHFLLTVSDPEVLQPVTLAWDRFINGTGQRGPTGADAALYRVLDELVDAHRPRIDVIEDELEELAERVAALEETKSVVADLGALRRRIVHFRRVMLAERDVLQALARRDYQLLSPQTSVYFRDVADHLTRTYESLEGLREHTDLLTQEHFAFTENSRSQILKRLSVISTIFLPLNFVTGFFGMNFTHLPYDSWALFSVGLSAMVVVPTGMMIWLSLKRWV